MKNSHSCKFLNNKLDDILAVIENKLKENINIDLLANEFDLSSRHLQRLFKQAFNQTLGLYIRSRKLAASINDLINTNLNVLDIALDYGFEYEQSYIRSFKREFGITPNGLRKNGQDIKSYTVIKNLSEKNIPGQNHSEEND